MKNKIKILITSCIMLVCVGNVSAQWRFGIEWNHTFMTQHNYNAEGVFQNKNLNAIGGMAGFLSVEYILPRNWTPNWLALSIRGKIGASTFNDNTSFEYNNFYIDGEKYYGINPVGMMFPINIEGKFLLTNNVRLYINGGVPNFLNLDNLEHETEFCVGYEYEVGFEFGFFRIGYKNMNFNKTFISGGRGNKYNNLHTLTAGFVFNGSRFLKKKSSLKVY